MFCRKCGTKLAATASRTCSNCGSDPLSTSAFCRFCGNVTKAEDRECPKCGSALGQKQTTNKLLTRAIERVSDNIIVTTGDIKCDYLILGPVYFQVSNKGLFSSELSRLVKQYVLEIDTLKKKNILPQEKPDWGFLYGEWSVGQNDFDKAFFVAVQELKKRASLLGADAIIAMRQDIDLDTNSFQYFYLQMYGTAVKFT